MATFADLMALLLCFFVLLLSFAEIDAIKYKMVVRSLDAAFGVQREVIADAIPKGTSIIAQEFSPGEPRPTPLNVVQQETTDIPQDELKVTMEAEAIMEAMAEQIRQEAEEFKEALAEEIEQGLISVENLHNRIIIRIQEQGSFQSGDAALSPAFMPILKKIHDVLAETEGMIAVAGHTDDVPIRTARFRSNWELSTSRATSVVHELLSYEQIPAKRFFLEGYADTQPLAPNDSAENRAKNRRVEIVVLKGLQGELTRSVDELMRENTALETEVSPL
ncbi:flagellar motor protein MotB [Methylophaga lonarensis MPL]|uniref:Flagellar motor protein MotB n=2 Tax=Methylophaga lonarensis TaxID=999151 RepID=M7PHU8_9GAMM|nr:flagellar motor protein MotB [Methylophaga lonarensis MPL]